MHLILKVDLPLKLSRRTDCGSPNVCSTYCVLKWHFGCPDQNPRTTSLDINSLQNPPKDTFYNLFNVKAQCKTLFCFQTFYRSFLCIKSGKKSYSRTDFLIFNGHGLLCSCLAKLLWIQTLFFHSLLDCISIMVKWILLKGISE